LDQFDMCEFLFSETRDQVLKTVKQLAASAFVEDPTEKYLPPSAPRLRAVKRERFCQE